VFVVTNQSGIARGYYTEEQMQTLHDWLNAELEKRGAKIDRIYHCPFHEEGTIPRYTKDSYDRKPKPGHADPSDDGFSGHQGALIPDRRQAG
jgi:D-glycero-D-manno-heptose 1,7-bisphosphate phosphatase